MLNPRRRVAAIAWVFFGHKLRAYMHYRSYIGMWMLSGLTPMVVMFVWAGLLASRSIGPGAVYTYFAVVFLVRQVTTVWVTDDLIRQIREGDLNQKLLRPMPCFVEHATGHLAGAAMRAVPALGIAVAIVVLTGSEDQIRISAAPLFLLAVALAWVIHFGLAWLIACLSFWVGDSKLLYVLSATAALLLGGSVAPLEFMPDWMRSASAYTPFASMVGAPVGILVERFAIASPMQVLVTAGAWAVAILTLASVTWTAGSRRYTAPG